MVLPRVLEGRVSNAKSMREEGGKGKREKGFRQDTFPGGSDMLDSGVRAGEADRRICGERKTLGAAGEERVAGQVAATELAALDAICSRQEKVVEELLRQLKALQAEGEALEKKALKMAMVGRQQSRCCFLGFSSREHVVAEAAMVDMQ